MDHTRRDLSLLLPALFAGASAAAPTAKPALPSKCYDWAQLPVKKNASTGAESRQVFDGYTHLGTQIDLHITTMPPGQSPHAAHHHAHEEMMFIKEGIVEATINGKASRVGPGSVIYVNSNEEHGLKSVGDVPAVYFVLAIGHEKES